MCLVDRHRLDQAAESNAESWLQAPEPLAVVPTSKNGLKILIEKMRLCHDRCANPNPPVT